MELEKHGKQASEEHEKLNKTNMHYTYITLWKHVLAEIKEF